MKKINVFLINLNQYILIGIFVLLNLTFSYLVNIISKVIYNSSFTNDAHKFSSIKEEFILAVLAAPLVETIIFQFIIIEILYEKVRKEIICLISALAFASTHLYNVLYFVFALIVGLAFAYLYFIGRVNKKAFQYVYLTHLLYNSIAFTLSHL